MRKAKSVEKSIRSGLWREDEERMRGSQLYGKSVGLIGFGRIGSNVARYAHAFNMRVHAYDIDDSIIYPDYVNKENSIVDVATLSDVFCVCVHLTESTKQLIDSTIIELFKSDVIVVNTSRGEVIDEALLFKKLQEGKIGGLALDVLDNEVNYKKSEIYKRRNEFDNLILTPHIAGLSEESEKLAFAALNE